MLHVPWIHCPPKVLQPLVPSQSDIEAKTALSKATEDRTPLQDLVVDKRLLVPGELSQGRCVVLREKVVLRCDV